jgi:hypothetical protein
VLQKILVPPSKFHLKKSQSDTWKRKRTAVSGPIQWRRGKALIKAIMKEGFQEGYCKECQLSWSAQREGHVKRKYIP